ncbi:MAG: trypsin-like peptidase domain-containing protein [Nitrospinae bacterium]|nr:trypsin-like peptidase domain-containing protein [Nitrospinota bacterium]
MKILQELESAFVSLAEQTRPAVVSLSPYVPPFPEEKKRSSFDRPRPINSASGVIIDGKRGYIVTNSHVVREVDRIEVRLFGGKKFVGQVVGQDEDTDLAVVKVDSPDSLPSAELGDSGNLRVGQLVVAVGNPYGLNDTLTSGIISGLNRENINLSKYEDFIQTDASINPGNSGGPLLNIRGEIVGINTAIINYAQNIGFAIPSNVVKSVVRQLIEFGEVKRGWLGVGIEPLSPEISRKVAVKTEEGVYVNSVFEGEPAFRAGIRTGDVILKIGGEPVSSPGSLIRMIGSIHPGQKVRLDIVRAGEMKSLTVELSSRKEKERVPVTPGDFMPPLGFEVDEMPAGHERLDAGSRPKVVVSKIVPGGVAEKGGLVLGDLISSVNDQDVSDKKQFQEVIGKIKKGKSVSLGVLRDLEVLSLILPN